MGRRSKKFGGGGKRGTRPTNYAAIEKSNEKFESYYNGLKVVPEDEKEQFWEALRRDLPNSFRFTGSRKHALAVQERLKDFYIPNITSIRYEGELVEPPKPVPWYPDQLAWSMTTPKQVVRRFPPFASFHKFLVSETEVGNISRQEVVSMIPPLLLDVRPGMVVLDMCAAPGSKSAQLMEMIHAGEEEQMKSMTDRLENKDAQVARQQGRVEIADLLNGEAELDGFEDDGRSTGLLIANDSDYKRAHMLIHQMKRLNSPNLLVTNHDATMYPSIRLPSLPVADGKRSPNRYLKFDRILADVPCSGDGTARKNVNVWKDWNPANGIGLHPTQARILVRALQMLKPGGRVVYSTCSMNPIENEAVIASAIDRFSQTRAVAPASKPETALSRPIKQKSGQQFEEPFKYLDSQLKEFDTIFKFYDLSPQFPKDRFMVRNADGRPHKTIYYTTALARDILTENEGTGMKFVHCGVKMFVKQDVQRPDVCPWRIQKDGLTLLEPWIGTGRTVKIYKKTTLRKLLVEMFPKVNDGGWKELGELGEWARDVDMGCCVLKLIPTNEEDGFHEHMVLPLWRSLYSLNLMLPKEERRAMLLRLFNDETPLVNTTHKRDAATAKKEEESLETSQALGEDGRESEDVIKQEAIL
ncbi:tRNA (cytosine-5-)-methyltransferase ncl1 [Coccidioides immitis RMSCC 3703]|uniref:tRNA (Cytosine-5-)-methyltransferase ncl1 n=1 Tax=Coccidioides immitis RMSCC 3703 TaxID=454286 RepID=A0A0J8QHT1_COCIT|nr:tRNA (cytosine-5-)-methyltransferase ncl1 [Coccidioides immitis RMSCC 3703]